MSKSPSKILAKLSAANDPRIAKLVARIEKIAASDAQEAQRAAAADRKARDAAVFVLGGALLAMIEKNDATAMTVARAIAGSVEREQDIKRLTDAVTRGVIPPVLKPRRTLSVAPAAPAATSGVVSGVAASA